MTSEPHPGPADAPVLVDPAAVEEQQHGQPALRVTLETVVGPAATEDFYALYQAAFAPLRTQAVARQVLHRAEFVEQMTDPRVWKFVAWSGRHPVGLTTLTRDLETVPWISADYFAAHFPEQTARNAVYYWGFTVTRLDQQRSQCFFAMLSAVSDRVSADRGVINYDICAFNNATLDLGSHVEEMSHRLVDLSFRVLDTQTYYCATLS